MRKIQIIVFIVIVILAISGSIYIRLGGTKEIEIKEITTDAYLFISKKYEGKRSSKSYTKLLNETADLVKSQQIKGVFSIYHFINPDSEQDTLNTMVGVIVADTTQKLPNGYKLERLMPQKAVQAVIKSHWLVSPNPVEVNKQIKEYALSKQFVLKQEILEKYHQDEEIITEIGIK
jgi:hypothetical protein